MNAQQAKQLMETSGNGFHCKVAEYFRAKHWRVLLSPFHIDPSTDKARELDLIAEKYFYVPQYHHGDPTVVTIRLLVEFKYIPKEGGVLFWFDSLNLRRAMEWVIRNTPFERNHITFYKQHYLRNREDKNAREPVAKLFASETQKMPENEPMYRAVNQCLSGYINNSREVHSKRADNVKARTISYPAIVCSSFAGCFRTDVATQADPVPLTSDCQLEINYAYVTPQGRSREEYVLIDLVQCSGLDDFLATIELEAEGATNILEQP